MALNEFGIVASNSVTVPADSAFFVPLVQPNEMPRFDYGREIRYADTSWATGGWGTITLEWAQIEVEDELELAQIWETAHTNYGDRVWVYLLDPETGLYKATSGLLHEIKPDGNNLNGTVLASFNLSISKPGIHKQNYQGGAAPTVIDSSIVYIYGYGQFLNNSFKDMWGRT